MFVAVSSSLNGTSSPYKTKMEGEVKAAYIIYQLRKL